MAKRITDIGLPTYDDLFRNDKEREEAHAPKVLELPLEELHPFHDHPFQIRQDQSMQELIESVREFGVVTPALVRPDPSGEGYEIISGHQRKYASEQTGKATMPAIVKELTDEEATIFMVDSNIQRENLFPSEKAFAYKLRLEAMNQQGKRTDLTCSPLGNKLQGIKSSDVLAEKVGESKNQVFRYIRLTCLIPPILEMVDAERIAFRPAVELSYLTIDQQETLFKEMTLIEATPSLAQSIKMKKYSRDGKLNADVISSILDEEKPNQKEKLVLRGERFSQYFPTEFTPRQKEDLLLKLLDQWSKQKARNAKEER